MLQVACHPQSPAFSTPSHRDHRHSRQRYRDDRDAVTPPACSPRSPCGACSLALHRHSSATACALDSRRHRSPRALAPPHLPPAVTPPCRTRRPPARVPGRSAGLARAGESDAAHAIFPVHAVVLAAHGKRDAPRPPADAPLPARFRHPPRAHRRGVDARNPPRDPRLPAPIHALASASSNLSTLMGHAGHVKELWQDMVALSVYDPELWDALNLAWEVGLGALNLAAQ
ncbi:hypothetical protein DFH09DRAFT_1081730 [Mycena vulgaris]|nr:hypothetical protein DFH09DRAFT_1081730 [Mycena vulgaris]